MGGQVSKNLDIPSPNEKDTIEISDTLIQKYLTKFIKNHCEVDSNGYIPYTILIAMFYTYLSNQQCILPIQQLENSMYHLVKKVIKDNFESSIVSSEGTTHVQYQGYTYKSTNYNYSYIYGLKLAKPVHSVRTNISNNLDFNS